MKKIIFFSCLFFLCSTVKLRASIPLQKTKLELSSIENLETAAIEWVKHSVERPNPLKGFFQKKQSKNKKAVALLLAFPFPFGIVGLHRIYLGCAPHIPVVYIASLGGVFGILPFIDFCVLLATKDLDKYANGSNVFMWVE